ncbi:heptosyltransferase-2 [Trichlorobacter thiogenes]|uniref:lipopolysaccharide heptosyltransferase II n=1 Tax=Trichlorobacter thiogenes TaxID=115783 RepID=A0A1T4R3V8_9BACT|nr:lipopolysaccharide heptosyltransferase II [Trichlorobacter thiogenes]SKA10742.1 heptosyltransferase-2 [Trichlorobacter thiogenes]
MQQKYHNILVRSVNWIGDAVMATPALMAVRETYPKARITLLANPMVGQLLQGHPAIDRVLVFDRKDEHNGLAGRLRLARQLKHEQFDLALILPNSFDSALIPWLARIPQRWGKASDGRSLFLTKRFYEQNPPQDRHEVQYYCDLLRSFGISSPQSGPLLATTLQEDDQAAALLALHGIPAEAMLLGINAGASFGSAKRWYPERFGEVARRLADEWNARIILFGGPDEVGIVNEIEQALRGNCLNLAGKTTVRQLMALIKRCNFFVTNDSGPMHIAAAFGVPLVAIFGPTDHVGTAPCSDKAIIVRQTVDCAPCKLRVCPTDHRCMTAVSIDDVVQAAQLLFKANITGEP